MFREQLLEQLKKFESRQLGLQQLRDWVLSHLQQILDSREDRTIGLANEIDALFIQEEEGLRSIDEIRQAIAILYTREVGTEWIERDIRQIWSSSERTVYKEWGEPQVVVTGLRTLQVV